MFIIPAVVVVLKITVDYRAGFSREVGVFPRVTLAIFFIVRTSGGIVEAMLNTGVVISADVRASSRLFVARRVQVALTISVVPAVG